MYICMYNICMHIYTVIVISCTKRIHTRTCTCTCTCSSHTASRMRRISVHIRVSYEYSQVSISIHDSLRLNEYPWITRGMCTTVMSHTCMSHVTHMHEACHTHAWGMSHTCMRHVAHMHEACRTHAWVTSHTCMGAQNAIMQIQKFAQVNLLPNLWNDCREFFLLQASLSRTCTDG